jgi:hypothetical protein
MFCEASCWRQWLVWLYQILPHYVVNGMSFEIKNYLTKMVVLILSTTFIWNIFHFEKTSARYYDQFTYVLMWNTRYAFQIVKKLQFCQQIFGKSSDRQFHENPLSGSRVVLCEQTDRQTDRRTNITELIVSFHNFANAPKNLKGFRWTGCIARMDGIEKHTLL